MWSNGLGLHETFLDEVASKLYSKVGLDCSKHVIQKISNEISNVSYGNIPDYSHPIMGLKSLAPIRIINDQLNNLAILVKWNLFLIFIRWTKEKEHERGSGGKINNKISSVSSY